MHTLKHRAGPFIKKSGLYLKSWTSHSVVVSEVVHPTPIARSLFGNFATIPERYHLLF